MSKILDKTILLLILTLALIPFPVIKAPFFGVINIQVYIYILIFIILIIQYLLRSKIQKRSLVNYIVLIFFLYVLLSIFLGRNLKDVAMQSLLYLPFLSACFIITNGTSLKIENILKLTIYSTTLSGLLAIYYFYYEPDLLPSKLLSEERIEWGRLYWDSATIVLISLSVTMIINKNNNINIINPSPLLTLSAIISVFPAILTFSRTLLLALIGISFLLFISTSMKNKLFTAISAIVLAYVTINFFSFDNVTNLFKYRVLDFLILESDNLGHINDRIILYKQYYDVFINYPIIGAGFGIPFVSFPEKSFYSDVTLVSFILPFGLLGLFIFGYFIYKLWSSINKPKFQGVSKPKKALNLILFFSVLISFNENILVYKEFIIIFALIVASFSNYSQFQKKQESRNE